MDRNAPAGGSPALSRLGCAVFAAGVAGLGMQDVLHAEFLPGLQPVPGWLPARGALAVLVGGLLVAAGVAIAVDRGRRPAARGLTALLWLWVLGVHLPGALADLGNGGAWTAAFEILAIGGAAAVIALPSAPAVGRISFGVALLAFGALHVVYRDYVASVIPAWIPGHMFWALITGAAHIAAGASLLVDRKVRLAAILLTVMFGSWVAILHVPRVIAHPAAAEWTSLFVATAMCGGSWLLAGALRDR